MSIRILFVIIVDIASDKDVTDTLEILTWHILSVHNRASDLIIFHRLGGDVPNLLLLALLVARLNFEPAGDNTLR